MTNADSYINNTSSDLIKKYHISYTVSIDGPQNIHDHYRRFSNGRGSFKRICENLHKLHNEGLDPAGFESVYTPYEMERGLTYGDVVDFLIHEFDAKFTAVIPVNHWFGKEQAKEERVFATQLRADARSYLCTCVDSNVPAKQLLAKEELDSVFDPSKGRLWCGLGQDTITIAADGSIYPCYMMMRDRTSWKFANSVQSLSNEIIPSDLKQALMNQSAINDRKCTNCALREFCAGCPGGASEDLRNLTGYDPVACAFRFGKLEGLLDGWRDKINQQLKVA